MFSGDIASGITPHLMNKRWSKTDQ